MGKAIVFVSPPFAGHLNPILTLVRAAAQAGHDVAVVTSSSKLDVVTKAGFKCVGLKCLDEGALRGISDTDEAVGSNPIRMLKQLRSTLDIALKVRDELCEMWGASRPDVVVADSVAVPAGLAAEQLGIPWITTIASPLGLESRHGTPAYLGGWMEGDGLWFRVRDYVGRVLVRMVKRGLAFTVRSQLVRLDATLYRKDGSESCYSPSAILGFGLNELEFQRDWPPVFQMIGPSFDNPEHAAVPELPQVRRRILITLGTHLPWAKASLSRDIVWLAERRKDVFFIGSLGAYSPDPSRREVAGNAVVYDFVPYAETLEQFDAIIHHGGAGITYAAIAAGRPSIIVPHDYDQFDYAARVVAKGAGLRVDKLCSQQMLDAIDQVLMAGHFPNLPVLSAAARSYDPDKAFLEVIQHIGCGIGSSKGDESSLCD